MAWVNEERDIPVRTVGSYKYLDGSVEQSITHTKHQETSSWRTGRRAKSPDDIETDMLSGGQSARRALYRKNVRDRSSSVKGKVDYDNGHTFQTYTRMMTLTNNYSGQFRHTGEIQDFVWTAPVFLMASGTGSVWPDKPVAQDMNYYGSTAIAAVRPNNPHVDLAVALAELKADGIPKLGSTAKRLKEGSSRRSSSSRVSNSLREKASDVSGDHLSYQFGVAPLVSDVQSFGSTLGSLEKKMRDWQNGSGKKMHRRYHFPDVNTTLTEESRRVLPRVYGNTAWAFRPFVGSIPKGGFPCKYVSTENRKTWFSGCFTYLVPDGDRAVDELRRRMGEYRKLYGSRVDSEVIWNLLPWSWLVDWNSNVGKVISNAEGFSRDGLVMRYGYVMQTITRTNSYLLENPAVWVKTGNSPYPRLGTVSTSYVYTSKTRTQASPFGFGLSPNSFTSRQWSILGALGMTKGNQMLR